MHDIRHLSVRSVLVSAFVFTPFVMHLRADARGDFVAGAYIGFGIATTIIATMLVDAITNEPMFFWYRLFLLLQSKHPPLFHAFQSTLFQF